MALSWNEIRSRALSFSREWAGETREIAEYQTFWNDFFNIFGIRRRSVALYQQKVELLGGNRGYIDLFWPGTFLAEHKSAGQDLDAAFTQATNYFEALAEEQRPRFIVVTDYKKVRLYDLEGDGGIVHTDFSLKDLSKNIRLFAFMTGYEVRKYRDEDPVNAKAVKAIAKLYEALVISLYPKEAIDKLLTRLVFCFFADDTGIFNKGAFQTYLEYTTKEDGSDVGPHLSLVFQMLNTPIKNRQTTTDEDLVSLPYVNGGLFADSLPALFGTREIRKTLISCTQFDWSAVSPGIFGSMFQSVMDDKARHDLGAHYTSEKNILKVISGLFLDELKAELAEAATNSTKLQALWKKIAGITLLDPACGCGNFLVVAYRELRRLELEILKRMYKKEAREAGLVSLPFDVSKLSKLSVNRMHGIEILPFPAEIARLSLWLADHMANVELGDYFGQPFANLPLTEQPHIVCDNALQLDWKKVVPAEKLSYILGNPPFLGHHLQTSEQKSELENVLHNLSTVGVMDYVSGWYVKAAEYIQGTRISCAFVSTNSISQGEQVGILWGDLLLPLRIQIQFAHRTFKWSNDASGKAAVYCVIIGFATFPAKQALIYEYADIKGEPHEIKAKRINPYLIDAPDTVVRNRTKPICSVPPMKYGNKPTDGGFLIFTTEEKKALIKEEPGAERFLRRYLGAEDFLNGGERWCLWLIDARPEELQSLPAVMRRVGFVRNFREVSKAATTRNYKYPALFRQITQPSEDYILVPRVSSESRRYIPMGFFSKDMIIADSCQAIPGATLYHFGILESEMHMAWMRQVCGRLKSDYRYSKDIVYNNFPWPENPSKEAIKNIEEKAQAVLDARKQFPSATLADLYNPETMPKALLKAHEELDRAVDRAYEVGKFDSELTRLEFLFSLYQKYLSTKQTVPPKKKKI